MYVLYRICDSMRTNGTEDQAISTAPYTVSALGSHSRDTEKMDGRWRQRERQGGGGGQRLYE